MNELEVYQDYSLGEKATDANKQLTTEFQDLLRLVLGEDFRTSRLYCDYTQFLSRSSQENRVIWTSQMLSKMFEFCKLKFSDVYYVRSNFAKNKFFYYKFDDEDLAAILTRWHSYFWGMKTGKEEKSLFETVKLNISKDNILPSIDRKYIMITNNLVWDRCNTEIIQAGDLEGVTPSPKVMTRMFQTSNPDKNVVKIPDFDDDQVKLLIDTFNSHKDIPVEEYEEDLQPLMDWAMGNRGRYQDMLYGACAPYKSVLPRFAIIPIGTGANGKSAYEGMIASGIGGDNVGTIPWDEIMSWDHLFEVQTIWLNCPSETPDDYFSKSTDDFKTMAAHESKTCKKKGASTGIKIKHEYFQFVNENEMPEFGKDVKALLDRLYPIRFSNDFSQNPVDNYAEKTFVEDKEFMPRFIGQSLAMAHYYSQEGHKWEMSKEARAELETIRSYAAPNVIYYNKFSMFVVSYDKFQTVTKDFLNYGAINGETYSSKMVSASDLYFSNYKDSVTKKKHKYVIRDGGNINRLSIGADFRSKTLTNNLRLEDFHEAGGSIINALEIEFAECRESMSKDLRGALLTDEEKREKLSDKNVINETLIRIAQKDSKYGSGR